MWRLSGHRAEAREIVQEKLQDNREALSQAASANPSENARNDG